MTNPNIRCGVNNCKYNDNSKHCCSLDSITVGNTTSVPHEKCDTECDSFEEDL